MPSETTTSSDALQSDVAEPLVDAEVADSDPKPAPPSTGDRKQAAVKDWAAFVLSGVGR